MTNLVNEMKSYLANVGWLHLREISWVFLSTVLTELPRDLTKKIY